MPRVFPRMEQLERCQRLRDLGLLSILTPEQISNSAALSEAILASLAKPEPDTGDLCFDGAEAAAEHLIRSARSPALGSKASSRGPDQEASPWRIGYVLKKFPRVSETFILNEILELERQGADVTVFSLQWPSDGVFHPGLSELRNPVVYLQPRKSQAQLAHLRDHVDALHAAREPLWEQLEDLLRAGRTDTWSVLAWGIDVALRARELGIEHLHAHFATVASWVARTAHAVTGIPFSITCHAKDIYRQGIVPEHFQRLIEPAQDAGHRLRSQPRAHLGQRWLRRARRRWSRSTTASTSNASTRATASPDAIPLVLGVGRLVEKKGFCHLIDAVGPLLRTGTVLRCAIVGEGEERERLQARIRALRTDKIELLGMRTQDEVRDLLGRAAMLVLPCIIGEDGNRDALPTVLLEAMASGVPIVSTPVAGVGEIVAGGKSGVLVPCGDADELRLAIARLLRDPNEDPTTSPPRAGARPRPGSTSARTSPASAACSVRKPAKAEVC